jgi:hypothetical protein
VLIINNYTKFSKVNSNSKNSNSINNSIRGVGSIGSKKVLEGNYIVDVFIKNKEIIKELKYSDKDRIENVIEVIGIKKDIKDSVKDVEDSIIVNSSVPRDYRMLLPAKRVV